jgi:Cu/Ag efflux protein CusF
MFRSPVCAVLGLVLACGLAPAQEGIQRGKLKSVDPDKGLITITTDGKDREFAVTDDTRIMDEDNKPVQDRLKDKRLKEGAAVMFRPEGSKDGKPALMGLRLTGAGAGAGAPGGDIRRGKVKKIDLEGKTITLTSGGQEHDYQLMEGTQVLGSQGKDLKERFKDIKEGSDVFFKAERRDGKDVLAALKPVGANDGNSPRTDAPPKVDTSKFKPLSELGKDEYQGFPGGLYPEGKNERPAAHEKAGLALAQKVQPLDREGKPSPEGKIVLLSVGMSNTTQEFSAFQRLAGSDRDKNPKLVLVDGAQGGQTAQRIADPDDNASGTRFWGTVDQRLQSAGVTREQVQAVWLKEADAGPSEGFPKYAQKLQAEMATVARVLHDRFPNLKLVYLSSRIYAGYATTRLNPEPYAYESGFAVKWLIEQQIKGDPALNFDPDKGAVKAPWLSWGPYLWANGTIKRADGLTYEQGDLGPDGTHPSASGQEKVARQLLDFLKSDPTAKPWFVAR